MAGESAQKETPGPLNCAQSRKGSRGQRIQDVYMCPKTKPIFEKTLTFNLTRFESGPTADSAHPPGLCRKTRYLSAGLSFPGRRFLHEI
jgi:hypothetical protein